MSESKGWKVIGGSVVGTSHIKSGIPCEDASDWTTVDGGGVCLVVADGAGSQPRSREGSEAVVNAVVGWACKRAVGESDLGGDVREGVGAARNAVDILATEVGAPLREFASTLGIVLIGENSVQVVQVGDCIVVLQLSDSSIQAVSPPGRGEYLNETTFITSEDWESDLRIAHFSAAEVKAVAISTDGLQFKILQNVRSGIPYVPFFEDVFNWCLQDEATDDGIVRFIDRLDDQSGDDKTLLVAVRADLPHVQPQAGEGEGDQSENGSPERRSEADHAG